MAVEALRWIQVEVESQLESGVFLCHETFLFALSCFFFLELSSTFFSRWRFFVNSENRKSLSRVFFLRKKESLTLNFLELLLLRNGNIVI